MALRAATLAAVLVLAHTAAKAASCASPQPIQVVTGSFSAKVGGSIARGEVDCWTLHAQAGQALSVKIESVESNAVFQLYGPGWKISNGNPYFAVQGEAQHGAADGQDAMAWSGRLAQTGDMLLVVGAMRGGSQYTLTTEIRGIIAQTQQP